MRATTGNRNVIDLKYDGCANLCSLKPLKKSASKFAGTLGHQVCPENNARQRAAV